MMFEKLKQFLTPPTFPDEDKTRNARNSFSFALVGFATSFLMAVIFLVFSPEYVFRNSVIIAATILSWYEMILLRKGYVKTVVLLQASIIWICVVAVSIPHGGLRSVAFIGGTLAALLLMGTWLDLKIMFIFIIISILAAIGLIWGENQGWIDPGLASDKPVLLVSAYSAFLFVLGGLLYITNRSINQALDKARLEIEQRKKAETEREKLIEEIHHLNAVLEQQVIERTEQLEAVNRELETFAYSVSHDLRTPLRGIDGFAYLLMEEHADQINAEGQRYLRQVRDNTKYMNQLIDALLMFSHLGRQAIKLERVDVTALVHTTLNELKDDHIYQQAEIVVGELPSCIADPALLKQVWINLLSNALKYSSKREQARIEIGWTGETYFVRDNGVGFDMRYAVKIFDAFHRLLLSTTIFHSK